MSNLRALLLAAIASTTIGVSPALADVSIATAGPMTGQYAWYGEEQRQGAEMAVADINAKGGLRSGSSLATMPVTPVKRWPLRTSW
jgi:branched-chain amino acid transport system substrate-binding protein